jgi:heat shock protein HtpX
MDSQSITNTAKTAVLLAGLGGLLVLIGSLIFGQAGIVLGLALGLALVGGSYWFSDRLAVKAARARPLEPDELPWLHETVAQLAARAEIPTPRLFLSPSPQPNAFATGRNERMAVVAVTQGLVSSLDRDEIAGVLAHELAHVKHRDILIGSVAAAIATGISAIANMAMWASMFGGGDEDSPNPFTLLLVAITAPIAAGLMQMAVSRSREYEADRFGASLMGTGVPLARALTKLELTSQRVPMDISPAQSSAWIVNPLAGRKVSFANLFSTHPSTADRVARLMEMAPAR